MIWNFWQLFIIEIRRWTIKIHGYTITHWVRTSGHNICTKINFYIIYDPEVKLNTFCNAVRSPDIPNSMGIGHCKFIYFTPCMLPVCER
jgi:hypothetical protein